MLLGGPQASLWSHAIANCVQKALIDTILAAGEQMQRLHPFLEPFPVRELLFGLPHLNLPGLYTSVPSSLVIGLRWLLRHFQKT